MFHKQGVFTGDLVRIKARGLEVEGVVKSVQHDWATDEYSIEMTDQSGQYRYWKQGTDGGEVELVRAIYATKADMQAYIVGLEAAIKELGGIEKAYYIVRNLESMLRDMKRKASR